MMDILTPLGQQAAQQELEAAAIFEENFPDIKYVHTPKDKPAKVDAVLTKDGEICAVVETKCRNFSMEKFKKEYWMQWLLTQDKVMQAVEVAASLHVPFVGFLYMVPDKTLMVLRISEPDGTLCADMGHANTYTKETVNGGRVLRHNVFVSMKKAKTYTSKKEK